MEETVTITRKEYERLKRKEREFETLQRSTLSQVKQGLDDAREGKVVRLN